MAVTFQFRNQSAFDNHFEVWDTNNGNAQVYSGNIPSNQSVLITLQTRDGGDGEMIYCKNNGPRIRQSWIKNGDIINI